MRRRVSRRELLVWSATTAGLAVPGSAMLGACRTETGTTGSTRLSIPVATPDRPVTLPLAPDNEAVRSGLRPERQTLRILTWGLYINPAVVDRFSTTYGVEVATDTFTSMGDAVDILKNDHDAERPVRYDVFTPQTDVLRQLVADRLLQPLNHDYLPNLGSRVWPELRSPYYDVDSRYTVPYVMWTDGIAWRNDVVHAPIQTMPNPYDALWTHAVPGRTAVLDNARDSLAFAMLRHGVHDINTADPGVVDRARADLAELVTADRLRFDEGTANFLPQAEVVIRESWSGTVVYAPAELPAGTPASVLSYWWPPHTHPSIPGVIANDTLAIPSSAAHPVLAHHFLDYLLDPSVARTNFSYTGYQPPSIGVNPTTLVADGLVAPSLAGAIISPDDLHVGLRLTELPPDAQQLWDAAYRQLDS